MKTINNTYIEKVIITSYLDEDSVVLTSFIQDNFFNPLDVFLSRFKENFKHYHIVYLNHILYIQFRPDTIVDNVIIIKGE